MAVLWSAPSTEAILTGFSMRWCLSNSDRKTVPPPWIRQHRRPAVLINMHRETEWNVSLIKKWGASKMWLKSALGLSQLKRFKHPLRLKEWKTLSGNLDSDSSSDVSWLLSRRVKLKHLSPPETVTQFWLNSDFPFIRNGVFWLINRWFVWCYGS